VDDIGYFKDAEITNVSKNSIHIESGYVTLYTIDLSRQLVTKDVLTDEDYGDYHTFRLTVKGNLTELLNTDNELLYGAKYKGGTYKIALLMPLLTQQDYENLPVDEKAGLDKLIEYVDAALLGEDYELPETSDLLTISGEPFNINEQLFVQVTKVLIQV
jgi:hypothetical protein